jgi:hypothetical protein
MQSLCAGVQPGGGRIRDCMRQHRTELSTACKVTIADRMLERQARSGNGPASIRSVPQQPGMAVRPSNSIRTVPQAGN